MRLVIARCSVDYAGRLTAHLPLAMRLLMVKADGSVLVHSDGGSYKPLNWMSPPCSLTVRRPTSRGRVGVVETWTVHARQERRRGWCVRIYEVLHDSTHDLGIDPGLVKDGVEAHLQALLAEQVDVLGDGLRLVRREYPTAIGPVDLLVRDAHGRLRRRRDQATRRHRRGRAADPLPRAAQPRPALAPVTGVFAAQEIKPQARVLATDRGIRCLTLDYDTLRGHDMSEHRLF